jgi:putative MFS transporter
MLFDAFDTLIITPILPKLVTEWKLNDVQVGLIGSAGFVGMAIGATLFGVVADAIGRLKVFTIMLLSYAISTGLCALTAGFTSLFVMRFVVGIGLGGLLPVAASYLAEYVPSRKRGQLISYFTSSNQVGGVLAYLVGFAIIVPYGWKWGFIVGVTPALLVAFIRKGVPESVRYLLNKGKIHEAAKVVEELEQRSIGTITVPREKAVEGEKLSISLEAKVRYRDLFQGDLAKTTIMMAFLWFCWIYSQFAIRVWFPILLTKELGYTLSFGLKVLTVGSLISIPGQILGGYTCDRWGRKISLFYSYVAFGATGYFTFWLGRDPTLGAIMISLMNGALGASAAASYTYTTEIFPTKVRATGSGFSSSMGRIGGICGPAVVGLIYAKLGIWWILHLNMALLVVSVVVVLGYGLETKRKTLEQIGEMGLKKVEP